MFAPPPPKSEEMATADIQTDAEIDSQAGESAVEESQGQSYEAVGKNTSVSLASFQTARPFIASNNNEYEEYLRYMPPELREDAFDILIINADNDEEQARNFKHHLNKDIVFNIHGTSRRPKVKLLEEIRDGSADNLDLAFSKALFVFLYVTKEFCQDTWTLLRGQACLIQAIKDQDKKWCVIPIHTCSKKSKGYSLPMILSSLKAINYWSGDGDQFYVDSVRKLLESKTGLILQRERELHERRLTCYEKHKEEWEKDRRYFLTKVQGIRAPQEAATYMNVTSSKPVIPCRSNVQDRDTLSATIEYSSLPKGALNKASPEETETASVDNSSLLTTPQSPSSSMASLNVNLRQQTEHLDHHCSQSPSTSESLPVLSLCTSTISNVNSRASDNRDQERIVDNPSISPNICNCIVDEPNVLPEGDGPGSSERSVSLGDRWPAEIRTCASSNVNINTTVPLHNSSPMSSACGTTSDSVGRFLPAFTHFDEIGHPYYVNPQTGCNEPIYVVRTPYPVFCNVPPVNMTPSHNTSANMAFVPSRHMMLPQVHGISYPQLNYSLMSTVANRPSSPYSSTGSVGHDTGDPGVQIFNPRCSAGNSQLTLSPHQVSSIPQIQNSSVLSNPPPYSTSAQPPSNPVSHDETSVKNPSSISGEDSSSFANNGTPQQTAQQIIHKHYHHKTINIKRATNVQIGHGTLYNTTENVVELTSESEFDDDDDSSVIDEEEDQDSTGADSSIHPMRSVKSNTLTGGSVPFADAAPSSTPHATRTQRPDVEKEKCSSSNSYGFPELHSVSTISQPIQALNISHTSTTDEMEQETDVKKIV